MSRMFCYQPQHKAVTAILGSMGIEHRVCPISNPLTLAGLEGATFVRVVNAQDQPPPEMIERVMANGFMTVDLSDEHWRARRSQRVI